METTSVNLGMFLKRRENGEILKVTSAGAVIEYEGTDASGQVRADKLHEEFDIIDMSDRDGIEALLKSKIEAGDASTGLYDIGLSYVVVDDVGGKITFQWFRHMENFQDLLNS